MKNSKTTFMIICLILWLCVNFVYSQTPVRQTLHNYLKALHTQNGFSGEILVAQKEQIIFQQAIGLSSRELGVALKPNQKYRIASITKTFTGALLVLAQRAGKLKLNDKVCKYIPALSSKFKNITLRHLLKHTSGLPHYEGIKNYWLQKSKYLSKPEAIIAEINQLTLYFKPGSNMKYTSLGYYLLAKVLENVHKAKYATILKDQILKPLKMTHSGVESSLAIVPNLVNGYHQLTDDQVIKSPYRNYAILKGAGDMYSSVNDLLVWSQSFLNNDLLTSQEQQQIFEQDKYGYGWFIGKSQLQHYYHGGGTWGYSSYLAFYPKKQVSIIVLANVSTLPVKETGKFIAQILFNRLTKIPVLQTQTQHEFDPMLYTGVFKSDSGKVTLKITTKNAKLYAQVANRPGFQIYSKGVHQFFGKKVAVTFSFELENRQVTGLTTQRMGKVFHFKKQ
ncbi:hypothetical protein BKI52_40235 [marine bacterium AO1-C]|nr:hypothetical protein BKI52_40235 [marine bacterium AO1-C]